MNCSMPCFPALHYLPEFAQTHGHSVSDKTNHLILCRPAFLPPSTFPSIRVFSNESTLQSGGQSIGASASASASILPVNIQGWFPLGLTDLISLLSKGHSSVFSSTIIWKHKFLGLSYVLITVLYTGESKSWVPLPRHSAESSCLWK